MELDGKEKKGLRKGGLTRRADLSSWKRKELSKKHQRCREGDLSKKKKARVKKKERKKQKNAWCGVKTSKKKLQSRLISQSG